MRQPGNALTLTLLKLKRFLRRQLHRFGFDIARYRSRPVYPEEANRFVYQKRFNQFDIAPGSVVLDIGSGHYPFLLATILVDLYAKDSPHRTQELIRDERPFLVVDIGHLPFRDKSVGFVYCSHVLEHVEDPKQACSELIRVGHRGYIETPNFASDLLFGWGAYINHKWNVMTMNNTLYFFEYTDRQRRGLDSLVWDNLIHGRAYHPMQEAYFKNQDLFNTMFPWKDRFECVVHKLPRKTSDAGEQA